MRYEREQICWSEINLIPCARLEKRGSGDGCTEPTPKDHCAGSLQTLAEADKALRRDTEFIIRILCNLGTDITRIHSIISSFVVSE